MNKRFATIFKILLVLSFISTYIILKQNFKQTNASFLTIDYFYTSIKESYNSSEFSLNPGYDVCKARRTHLDLLFISFVIIAPGYFEKRNEIRNTWANKQFTNDLRNIFVVATSTNETINLMIRDEFELYQDIVQINDLVDSYRVINIKIMKAFKWIAKYCTRAKYILRICDDVIVNTPKLIKNFRYDPFYKYEKNKIYAMTLSGVGPDHNPSSKWYVSELEFNQTYPPEYKGVYPKYPQGNNTPREVFEYFC